MHRDVNVVGSNVAKFRYQRGWTQDELVAKLQVLGCYMTVNILANIETRRSPATDRQIVYFAEIFGVKEGDLFPGRRQLRFSPLGLEIEIVTRRPCPNRRPRSRPALAEFARK